MGRFGDLWKSGKFVLKKEDEPLSEEVVSLMTDAQPAFGLNDSSNVILSALRTKRGMETGRWLNSLTSEVTATQDRLTAVAEVPGTANNGFDEMLTWMNQLFQQFRDLAFEFNKTAGSSDLLITVEMPQLHDKNASRESSESGIKVYRGRLTTSQWALGLIGQEESIAIHLIPAAMLLGFIVGQFSDKQFPPFMEIRRANVNGKPGWTIGGEPASVQTVPYLAKELLGDLIRVASGVMSESELFSSGKELPRLGENTAVGYPNTGKAPEKGTVSGAEVTSSDKTIHEACDVVDTAVDQELKRLYAKVATLRPDSPEATPTRTQISSLEKFRSNMLAAFEEYTNANN
jgi:hypothetical protein